MKSLAQWMRVFALSGLCLVATLNAAAQDNSGVDQSVGVAQKDHGIVTIPLGINSTSRAVAMDVRNSREVKIGLVNASVTPFGIPIGAARPVYGGDFDGNGMWYVVSTPDTLYSVDTTSGVFTLLGQITGIPVPAGSNTSGLTWDYSTNTMYMCNLSGGVASLYTLDLATRVATPVGQIITGTIIDIACSNTGQIYGIKFATGTDPDSLVSINKVTGAGTTVGTLGVNVNFAHGLDFDPATDSLFYPGYIGGGVNNLYRINTQTGLATLVGPLAAGEYDCFSVIGSPSVPPGFFDDFEAYTVGQRLACQDSINWTTWSLLPCNTTEDALISSAHAFSGTKSVVIVQNNDLVKRLGSVTTGIWKIKFKIYIPTGKAGYFNTLAGFTPNTFNWGMEVYFDAPGGGRVLGGSATAVPFTYVHDAWQSVEVVVNLDSNRAYFRFNGTEIHNWQWTLGGSGGGSPLRLDANDFFGATANDEMYVDDYHAYEDNTTVGVDEDGQQTPETFVLNQNYPNPFNPNTTIRYALPKDAFVSLKVYNVLGQEIATLREEVQHVGFHDIVWNGRNLTGGNVSSGVYFYRLDAQPTDGSSPFTSFRKMLLVK